MPLLGPKEKGELEKLVHDRLVEYWNAHGSNGLLAPGMSIVLDSTGPFITPSAPAAALASIEVRTLFTALCHLTADGPGSMPRDSLDPLATEATSALATQVNRYSPD
jgi:hypothetical protein